MLAHDSDPDKDVLTITDATWGGRGIVVIVYADGRQQLQYTAQGTRPRGHEGHGRMGLAAAGAPGLPI